MEEASLSEGTSWFNQRRLDSVGRVFLRFWDTSKLDPALWGRTHLETCGRHKNIPSENDVAVVQKIGTPHGLPKTCGPIPAGD